MANDHVLSVSVVLLAVPPECSVFVSVRLLDTLHLVLSDGGDGPLRQCLTSAYNCPVPAGGDSVHFQLPDGTVSPLHTPVSVPLVRNGVQKK